MNNVEAKFILQGYRPNGADAADATFVAALEQTKQDPALHEWFAREQAFDSAVSAKLGEVPAPAGLREAILAGGRVTATDTGRRGWWQHPALMAVAASIAVVFVTALALWPKPAVASNELATFALDDTLYNKAHGGHGVEAGTLQAFLMLPTTRLGGTLPVDFDALRKAGCRTVDLEGRDVLEVCFKRNGTWFHCYIARRADFPALTEGAVPAMVEKKGACMAAWSDASRLYVVVTKSGHEAMASLL